MIDARAAAIAAVEQELAEFDAIDAAVAGGLEQRHRRGSPASAAYSLRLDPGELAALERRAIALGIKPSVLARNLIRMGLRGIAHAEEARAVLSAIDRLEADVAELRSLVA
jgi:hypothetical protein